MELGPGRGPLRGVRVVELAGIGPAPHACTLLADLGADVLRIARPGGNPLGGGSWDLLTRGRANVALDLKSPAAVETVLALVESADVFVEGMRPGVTERLGLGPEDCLARNPRLVYARMTGWGQDGPLAATAGHDLTYLALTGQLHGLGQDPGRPQFPTNLVGDFGGGSTYLAVGVLAALLEARSSGRGQVVDAAIVDGVSHLALMVEGMLGAGMFTERRATNLLDGGAPFYRLYRTSDARWMAVGALEPQFFAALVEGLGVADVCPPQHERPEEMAALFERTFATRTLAEWTGIFEHTDACVAPVLTLAEAARHPHLAERGSLVEVDGVIQGAPAPRFSRTPAGLSTTPRATPGADTREALTAWGITGVDDLLASGAARQD
jgi:alpha-methylacyl-CoA racemase